MADFQEYPKAMYGPNDAEATVNSAEEEKALGAGWIDGHKYWAAKADPVDCTKSSGIDGDAGSWTAAGMDKDGYPVPKGSATDVTPPTKAAK